MSLQKFRATERREFSKGVVGWAPGGPFDCLGPYAKVQNCPIIVDGKEVGRRTCYATGYADTYWSVPACTRWKGKYVGGFFVNEDNNVTFRVYDQYKHLFTTTHRPGQNPEAERSASESADRGDR